jgi:hypothetical protein
MLDSPEKRPRLSIVIEMTTRKLAPDDRVLENIRETIAQASVRSAEDSEVLLVTARPWRAAVNCRVVEVPGAGYYALKNAGFAHARGEVVLFLDADCRICPGYVERVIDRFADPKVWCVTGRTQYAGKGILARINTTLSFGYLHDTNATTSSPYAALAHNTAVLECHAPPVPFGPWCGRVGGDGFLTSWYRDRHHVPLLDRDLIVLHEDPSWSPIKLMERHLRECFQHVSSPAELVPTSSAGRQAVRAAFGAWRRRRRKLRRYGPSVGLTSRELWAAEGVLIVYWIIDLLAVAAVFLPPLGARWMRYQTGR